MINKFTPGAEKMWGLIPGPQKEMLLNNVWCSHCRESTTITDYSAKTEENTLIMEGKCHQCQKKVVRVID